MTEQEFERFLANAYLAPADRPEAPQIAPAVVDRVERRRRAHTLVLAFAGLLGVCIAALAVLGGGVATILSRTLAHPPPEPAAIDPTIVVAIGFFLMLLAAARHALREL